jgi:hypothetical protein
MMQHSFILPKNIYNMPKILRTKEWFARYRTLFTTVMELQETFIKRVMRQPNVRARLQMKAKPPQV